MPVAKREMTTQPRSPTVAQNESTADLEPVGAAWKSEKFSGSEEGTGLSVKRGAQRNSALGYRLGARGSWLPV